MHGLLLIALVLLSSCQAQQNDIDIEYITDPCLIPTKDNQFRLCDDMVIKARKKYHAVPMGFKTDLASIPRIMWPIFSPSDYDSIASAVLHDWHYCCVTNVSRKRADVLFYSGLRSHGMHKIKASIYYYGVRAIGWLYYTHGEGLIKHRDELNIDDFGGRNVCIRLVSIP